MAEPNPPNAAAALVALFNIVPNIAEVPGFREALNTVQAAFNRDQDLSLIHI